jgi:hypothetical protein
MRGVRPGPLAFQCFDLADRDPELALLLAVTAVRLGYELLPKTSIVVADAEKAWTSLCSCTSSSPRALTSEKCRRKYSFVS